MKTDMTDSCEINVLSCLDSLDNVEVIVSIEDVYGFEIPEMSA